MNWETLIQILWKYNSLYNNYYIYALEYFEEEWWVMQCNDDYVCELEDNNSK